MPMRTRIYIVLVLCALIGTSTVAFYARRELQTAYPTQVVEPLVLDIPSGIGTRAVLGLLSDRNVIRSRYLALAYLFYKGQHGKLQAGEYHFDRPMTIPEVMTKLVKGEVYLHKFTVPEGLTLIETAAEWERQKFGTASEFVAAAESAIENVRKFDARATSVEGYLFPETYSFPSRTSASQAVAAMLDRFQAVVAELRKSVATASWPLGLRETATLASLIESEAAHESERAIIASVYLNRLSRNILLQCDPTVIYALEQAGKYRGSLLLADLKFNSPYNTYMYPGLPPGPIANPGYASLLAAVQPATTRYLYFVRTIDGKHTFSETLAAHNRAVAAYRALMRRRPQG
jgi:UPF0755 protein